MHTMLWDICDKVPNNTINKYIKSEKYVKVTRYCHIPVSYLCRGEKWREIHKLFKPVTLPELIAKSLKLSEPRGGRPATPRNWGLVVSAAAVRCQQRRHIRPLPCSTYVYRHVFLTYVSIRIHHVCLCEYNALMHVNRMYRYFLFRWSFIFIN